MCVLNLGKATLCLPVNILDRRQPMNSRHLSLLLGAVVVTACTASSQVTRADAASASIPLKLRADVLSEVIIMRYGRISSWGQVDACSVYRALDRDPSFRERLDTTARSKLTDESAAMCGSADADATIRGRWYVREIARQRADEITVLIAVIGESGTHRETYALDERYRRGWWVLREVRTSDFSID